jgi:alpha-L-fucosidase
VDSPIGNSWGYIDSMRVATASAVVNRLIDIVSKNGTMMLNLSPKADGTLPQDQVETLLGIGKWLQTNGEAIYDTHNWIKFGEGGRDVPKINFTVKRNVLYAIIQGKYPVGQVTVTSLPESLGKVGSVSMLGRNQQLTFSQDNGGLKVTLPGNPPCDIAWTLKITGLRMNPDSNTTSGNPIEYQ